VTRDEIVALFDHLPGLMAADTKQRLRQQGGWHVAIPAFGKLSAERRAQQ